MHRLFVREDKDEGAADCFATKRLMELAFDVAAQESIRAAVNGVDRGGMMDFASPDVMLVAISCKRFANVGSNPSRTANASLAGAGYVVRRAVAGETATSIMQEAANDLRGVAWRAKESLARMCRPWSLSRWKRFGLPRGVRQRRRIRRQMRDAQVAQVAEAIVSDQRARK